MLNIQIKIWHKLFFTILLVIMLILAINVWFSRLSFQHGFSQYIEEIRSRRLDKFSQALSEQYQQQGSWNFLQNDLRMWHQLMSDAELAPPPPPQLPAPPIGRDAAEFEGPDPRHTEDGKPGSDSKEMAFSARHPPPHLSDAEFAAPPPLPPGGRGASEFEEHGPERRRGEGPEQFAPPGFGPPGAHAPPPPFMMERIGLLDSARMPVLGPPPRNEPRLLPIKLKGEVVGYLVVGTIEPFRSELDRQFADEQLEYLFLTALFSLLIAIIAALFLARLFNRPIARLVVMAAQLTQGRFDSRMATHSRDELGNLAADINILAETLEQNQNSRRQWIADISHELRTPLTVLIGELEAMEDGVRPLNTESMRSLAIEVKQLQRLVDDLYQLSLADLGSLSYEMESIAAFELLHGVLDGFENPIKQKQITLTVQCDGDEPLVFADAQRLTQLLTNLLENSLRYTDAGGEIKVYCEVGATLAIHIEDSAPGVPAELIPHIFDRLFRVNRSRSREHGGSGLGLSIVQSIAKAHGGKLTAEPSVLGGLKISLQLPIKSEMHK